MPYPILVLEKLRKEMLLAAVLSSRKNEILMREGGLLKWTKITIGKWIFFDLGPFRTTEITQKQITV
jgi:hypothetical protein